MNKLKGIDLYINRDIYLILILINDLSIQLFKLVDKLQLNKAVKNRLKKKMLNSMLFLGLIYTFVNKYIDYYLN